jgi:MYXO-CTERM domain-containing protein
MWHVPGMSDCGFGGLASVGGVESPARDSWYNGNFGCVVRAQEIGHNYGMGHSHSYNCPNGTLVPEGDECEHVEYGDPYDPMGGGCDHMNVAQKAYMGWLEECNVVTTEANGSFNVVPTELPCNGTQALRFPAGDGRWYYVEYRQSYGVDAGFDAVLLHLSTGHDYSPSPYIIEAGVDDDGDTTYFMEAGDTFTDPTGNVSFTVAEMLDTHAVIDVTFPGGGSGEPSCDGGGVPEMAGGAVGSLECDSEPFPLDVTPPTVTITYPADGDVFQTGSDFTITAEAMDDRWVTEAELYVQVIGQDEQPVPLFKLFDAPFGFVVRDGPNMGQSEPVVIEVRDDVSMEDTGGSGDESADTTTDDPSDTNDDEDPEETGDEADTSTDDGGAPLDDDGGCSCNTDGRGDRGAVAALGLLVLGIGARRRRR